MIASKKLTTKNVYKGIIIGVAIAMSLSLLFSLIFTWLIFSERIGEEGMKYAAMITACAATFAGATVSVKYTGKQKFLVGMAVSVVYLVVLLMSTATFFEGQYQNVVGTVAMALLGSLLACVMPIGTKKQSNRNRKKRRYR